MDSILSAFFVFGSLAAASPANPIKVAGSTWLGNGQVSTNDGSNIYRDGGAQGSIDGTVVQVYADTSRGSTFVAPNSIVAQTFVATEVTDFTSGPSTFCGTSGTGTDGGNDRLHLGNLVETVDGTGAIWYVDIANSDGCKDIDGCPAVYGVALVTVENSVPVCTPLQGYWNADSEPSWGSSAAIGPLDDGFIYVAGQLSGAPGDQYGDVYVARVPKGSALNYSTYQYYNGSAYTSQRLIDPNFNGYSPASVLANVGDFGSWFYSPYYNQYVILGTDTSVGNAVIAYTAEKPEGPYSEPVTIYQNSTFGGYYEPIYAPEALPTFDTSGKTLTFVASLFGVNSVSGVIKVEFE